MAPGVASGARPSDPAHWPALPAGARWARDVVTSDERIRSAVEHLLDRVALAGDAALAQVVVDSGLVAVTPDGDVLAPGFVRGGSGAPSQLEITAAMEEAKARADAAARESEQARFARAALAARAVVAGEKDDGVVELPQLMEFVENTAELIVGLRDLCGQRFL